MGEKQEGGDKKQNEGQIKGDAGVTTVVLKFDMHCDGCAKKIKRFIKNIPGVENVKTDSSAGKLTVVGKVDPVEIKERVEGKTKKKVELLSLQQNKPANKEGGEKKSDDKKSDDKKSDAKSDKQSEDKKEKPKEPPVATVLLKTRVHCDGCAHKIKKIVNKYDGVQDVNVDLQKDTITVKGTMNMKDLLPYLNLKLKRDVAIASPKKDEGAGGDKKPKEGGGGEKPKEAGGAEKPKEAGSGEKPKEGGGDKPKDGGASEKAKGGDGKKEGGDGEKKDGGSSNATENVTKFEVNKMEYTPYGYGPYGYASHAYTFDPRQQGDVYGHQVVEYWHAPEFSQPPQMFSDENPNACSVM